MVKDMKYINVHLTRHLLLVQYMPKRSTKTNKLRAGESPEHFSQKNADKIPVQNLVIRSTNL